MKLEQRVEKLERTAMSNLDCQIESLMTALLHMGTSQQELERIINEVKS